MKQSELKQTVDQMYLEGLSKSIKRSGIKTSAQQRYEEANGEKLISSAVSKIKQTKQVQSFIEELQNGGETVINNYKAAFESVKPARGSIEEIVGKVIKSVGKLNDSMIATLNKQLDVMFKPSFQSVATFESMNKDKFKKLWAEDDNVDMNTGDASMTQDGDADDQKDFDDESGEGDIDPENKDAMDEADEILGQIDLVSLSNGVRLELIEAIIDSAQNAPDDAMDNEANDDDFSNFMQSIADLVDSFRYEGEEEGEEGFDDLDGDTGEGSTDDLGTDDLGAGDEATGTEEPQV